MNVRELAIKENKTPLLTLVRAFASPVVFWRGEWFAWMGTHYEQVAQQGIERQVMAFLEEKSPTAVNGSMIHRFIDLLRIVRHADHPTAPCWLTTARLPVADGEQFRRCGQSCGCQPAWRRWMIRMANNSQ